MSDPLHPYDAVLVCSYGGPRKMDDVLPFMRNATNGRGVPDARLIEVSGHYKGFAGVSPINARNLEIVEALRRELAGRGSVIPVAIGNRNWTPFFRDTLTDLYQQGVRRVLALFTSAYVCYSGCRQYREDLALALAQIEEQGMTGMVIDKARAYSTTQGFIDANVDAVVKGFAAEADKGCELGGDKAPTLVFVTHSIPTAMFDGSGPVDKSRPDYEQQHLAVCEKVVSEVESRLGHSISWELAYCSRSGPPHIPWLEPDVNDTLERLAGEGQTSVVCHPIGFINDHMEVVYDLDTEAKETADEQGLSYTRAATVGADSRFVSSLADVLCERAAQARGEIDGLQGGVGVGRCDNADSVQADAVAVTYDTCPVGDTEGIDPKWRGFRARDAVQPIWPAISPVGDSKVSPDAPFLPTVCGG